MGKCSDYLGDMIIKLWKAGRPDNWKGSNYMEKEERDQRNFLNELHTKSILIDMKSQIVQTICSLVDDEVYTKNDAVYSLLEVVSLIELEEKKVDLSEARSRLVN